MTTDREFIDLAAKGLEITPEPLKPLAQALNMTVDEVIARIARLIDEGKVRRFAASVRHQPIGFSYNAMVIAKVEEQAVDRVGGVARQIDAVSHCYHRDHPDGDPFCVYIMMHGRERATVEKALDQVKNIAGVRSVEVCESIEELKKSSVSGVTTVLD
jgi:DNA-binding Lrp family transcriptional regulator